MKDRIPRIRQQLETAFTPALLTIQDDSAAHQGHEGTQKGAGHYSVTIISEKFTGKSLIQRHRLVYTALAQMMEEEIHALSIQAKAPDEK